VANLTLENPKKELIGYSDNKKDCLKKGVLTRVSPKTWHNYAK
jgi:hypothetical protein